jgi:O-acetylhomoserine/O-acetylserine sulfhydrylase-like pyridoxal-dependent enzyme
MAQSTNSCSCEFCKIGLCSRALSDCCAGALQVRLQDCEGIAGMNEDTANPEMIDSPIAAAYILESSWQCMQHICDVVGEAAVEFIDG